MAVTTTNLPAGNKGKRWNVTFSADADVAAVIPHGLGGTPEFVILVPLNVLAYVGQVAKGVVDGTNINLVKANVGGSGGAQVEVIAYRPLSAF